MASWEDDSRISKSLNKSAKLVDAVRASREERDRAQLRARCASEIQRIWRGFATRRRVRRERRELFNKRIGDVAKLSSALVKMNKPPLKLSVPVVTELLRLLLSLKRDEDWFRPATQREAISTFAKMLSESLKGGGMTATLPMVNRFLARLARRKEMWDDVHLLARGAFEGGEVDFARSFVIGRTECFRFERRDDEKLRFLVRLFAGKDNQRFVLGVDNLVKHASDAALRESEGFWEDAIRDYVGSREGESSTAEDGVSARTSRMRTSSNNSTSRSREEVIFLNLLHLLLKKATTIDGAGNDDATRMEDGGGLKVTRSRVSYEALRKAMEAAPPNLYVGNEGAMWSENAVLSLSRESLGDLDFQPHLTHVLRRAFRVRGVKWRERAARAEKELRAETPSDASLSGETAPSLNLPRMKSSNQSTGESGRSTNGEVSSATSGGGLYDAWRSVSTWAKRLGLASSSTTTSSQSRERRRRRREADEDEEEEGEEARESKPLLSSSNKRKTETDLESQSVFVDADLALGVARFLASFFARFPPSAKNPRSLSILNAIAFGFPSGERLFALGEEVGRRDLGENAATTWLGGWKHMRRDFGDVVFVTSLVCTHLLLVADRTEIYDGEVPVGNRGLLSRLIKRLNEYAYGWVTSSGRLANASQDVAKTPTSESRSIDDEGYEMGKVIQLLSLLYDTHSRRPLVRNEEWVLHTASFETGSFLFSNTSLLSTLARSLFSGSTGASARDPVRPYDPAEAQLASRLPWTLPFRVRAFHLQDLIANDRVIHQPPDERPPIRLKVYRNRPLDEALVSLINQKGGEELRKRIYVVFVNELGMDEAGIDARGLFKEFITSVASTIFDPSLGLFIVREGEGKQMTGELIPNPAAVLCAGGGDEIKTLQLFEFAGRILGKAFYEGILIQPIFSFHVLAKMLGKFVTISDLETLDPELHRNLLFLKTCDPRETNVADLGLTFEATPSSPTGTFFASGHASAPPTVELVPGGSRLGVNESNKYLYVNLMAAFKLNECDKFLERFFKGFYTVVDRRWLADTKFSEREFQILISGEDAKYGAKIDVNDWKDNTSYAGGYFPGAPTVSTFWRLVKDEMGEEDRRLLLKFVTSCSRAPLFGFGALNPPFTVQRVPLSNPNQLPTASTCFNVLKLPPYSNLAEMKAKVLMAIRSGSGFELS